ncbi:hypothetical protein [Porphyromonas sp.]
MKLNLLKISALLCGLFFLGSCAQEAPQADNKTTLEDGPRVAVPIELEVSIDAFDAPKSLDQEARAYTGAKTPITVKDGNNKVLNDDLTPHPTEAQKILTRSRAKFIEKNPTLDAVVKIDVKPAGSATKTYIGQAKMEYSPTKDKYTFGGDIEIPQAVVTQAKESGATTTITLYAGGEYDEANKTFKLSSVMEVVSLRDLATTPIELPILYKSEPVAFKVVNGALKPDNSSSVGTLKPLGSLLLVTFRNNMQQTVTFDGINAVSNSFFGPNNQNKQAVYDIATGAFSNTVSYESPYAKSTEGGAGYTFFYKDFSSGSSSLPGGGISIASGASSDKALVFWGFHTGGSAKVSTSNKLKAITGASMEADVFTPSTSLLHVYAQNVTVGGLTPSRPNYSIAPIGGANLTPENGKAYTLNCEFYEQPRQMLGYFAKGYIYKENNATWKDYNFDGGGSNDPNVYLKKSPSAGSGYKNRGEDDRKSSADNFLLVNSKQVAETRTANGGVTTTKGQMYLPNESWLNLVGLNRPIAFVSSGNSDGRYKTLAGFSSSQYYRGQIVSAELPYKDDHTASGSFQYKGFVYADYHKDYQSLTDGQLAVAYRQLYMEPRNSSTGYQPRSKYQTIMRVMTTGKYILVENERGRDYGTFPSTLTMESLYVGKYFVGNVMTTPLYVTRGASQPFLYAEDGDNFWRNKPEVSRDRVDRALLNVPTFDYNQISEEDLLQDAGKTSFRNKTKAAPLMNHWCDAPAYVWYSKIIGQEVSVIKPVLQTASTIMDTDSRKIENRVYGFADGAKGFIWVMALRYWTAAEQEIVKGRMRTYTYQVLRPYSTKYQGNDGFRNNNN